MLPQRVHGARCSVWEQRACGTELEPPSRNSTARQRCVRHADCPFQMGFICVKCYHPDMVLHDVHQELVCGECLSSGCGLCVQSCAVDGCDALPLCLSCDDQHESFINCGCGECVCAAHKDAHGRCVPDEYPDDDEDDEYY